MNNFDLKKFLIENKLTSNSRLKEGTFDQGEIALYLGPYGLTHIFKRGSGYYGYNDKFDFEAKDRAELEKILMGYELTAGSLDEAQFTDYSNNELAAYARELSKQRADAASKGQSDLVSGINKEIEAATRELKKRSQALKSLTRTDVNENVTTTVWSNFDLQFMIDNNVRMLQGIGGNLQVDWHLIEKGFYGAEEKALKQVADWKESMEESLGIEPQEEVRIVGGKITTDKIEAASDKAAATQASAMKKGGFSNN